MGGHLIDCERSCGFGKEKEVVRLLVGVTLEEIGLIEKVIWRQVLWRWGIRMISVVWNKILIKCCSI